MSPANRGDPDLTSSLVQQRMTTAYREPVWRRGRALTAKLIAGLSSGVPKPLAELITLGRTLTNGAADVLAYLDRPGTSNGPTEALNVRLKHLCGSALGFRNLTNYARSLLATGGFRPQLHPRLGWARFVTTGSVLEAVPGCRSLRWPIARRLHRRTGRRTWCR